MLFPAPRSFPEGCVQVRQIVVTPLTIHYLPPGVEKSNRGMAVHLRSRDYTDALYAMVLYIMHYSCARHHAL